MSIFYDVICEDFVSLVCGCSWIGAIGTILEFIAGIGAW